MSGPSSVAGRYSNRGSLGHSYQTGHMCRYVLPLRTWALAGQSIVTIVVVVS